MYFKKKNHNALEPQLVDSQRNFNGAKVLQAFAGSSHSAAVTDKQLLFTWGDPVHGKLGHVDMQGRPVPTRVLLSCYLKVNETINAINRIHLSGKSPLTDTL